MVGFIKRP